jgi:hypothetical protein
MTRHTAPLQPNPSPDMAVEAMRARLEGTNVNANSLLATDYLNHFNEFVMLFEMVFDMPDLFEEVRDWRRKSYCEHFAESGLSDRDLAIAAYEISPPEYRGPFDSTVDDINETIEDAVKQAAQLLDAENPDRLATAVAENTMALRSLIDIAGAIINDVDAANDQDDIDRLFDD